MNLETNSPKKAAPSVIPSDDFDFDFKPITSGLGFHHQQKTTEIKPAFQDSMNSISITQPIVSKPVTPVMKEAPVYQNDLSIFYGRETVTPAPVKEPVFEKTYRPATKTIRTIAYILDLGLVLSVLGLVLTVMSRIIEMDLLDVWSTYPNEITPLVATLFAGFYMIYFSIFEKTSTSTFGKGLLNIRVVNLENRTPDFSSLLLRSFVSLTNFISLGLFSYFDLQNKVSSTKVIKAE
jgi:uncharacterized RDD family membrane protein YckC